MVELSHSLVYAILLDFCSTMEQLRRLYVTH